MNLRRLQTLGLMLIASTIAASSQESADSTQGPTIHGRVALEHDLYDISAIPGGSSDARRPASLLRLILNPVVTVGAVSIPFDLVLSVPESATRGGAGTKIGDYVTNPANAIGVAPRMGWAALNLGTHTPRLSTLSGGDVALFGVGADLAPGDFRFVASAGTIGQPGGFDRHAIMGRVAYAPEGGAIGINAVRVRDDGGTLPSPGLAEATFLMP
jgi:hypothetical protein